MFAKDILFWNVDTQFDFMSASGKLYVPGAEQIKPILKQITAFAKSNNIQVVNTADFHYANSKELSNKPDFITSFPATLYGQYLRSRIRERNNTRNSIFRNILE